MALEPTIPTGITTATTPFVKASLRVDVQFRVDGLKDLFASPGTKTIRTPTITPGFQFEVESELEDGVSDKHRSPILMFKILSVPGHVRPPFVGTVTCMSLSGRKVYHKKERKESDTYYVDCQHFGELLHSKHYRNEPSLQKDNAVLVDVSLKCIPDIERDIANPGLALVRRYISQDPPIYSDRDLRFIAYDSVENDRLLGPRASYCSSEVLGRFGIDVDKLEDTGLFCVIPEMPADENLDGLDNYTSEILQDDSDIDWSDSDMDEDEEPNRDNPEVTTITKQKITVKVEPKEDDHDMDETQAVTEDLSRYNHAGMQSIIVTGVAADTWEAVLHWLYTDQIMFAPLTRSGDRNEFCKAYEEDNPGLPRPCSCRSIYHIASKLDIAPLKAIAFRYFQELVDEEIAFDELFDHFSRKYPEVKDVIMNIVVKNWKGIRDQNVLEEKMTEIASGKLPHAGPIMAELLKRAALSTETLR